MDNNKKTISRSLVREYQPARLELNDYTLMVAKSVLDDLWKERLDSRGRFYEGHRDGSAKFASLLAQRLFGGKLCGNQNHSFVELPDGKIIDLNDDQRYVAALGSDAHARDDIHMMNHETRASFGSCVPRIERWAQRAVEACPKSFAITAKTDFSLKRDFEPSR
ncbi:hypothetical protein HNP46_000354 [Pseudomonas nitritireducens]|uniref:Uncharacterized protein n=1 Tax=Pseudomonas nitroreducens TaxID=46680 RepID=A0A7W7KG79_PSENT|nr:hypothetical protein [Pseudomonas nitritireducens]MBB4861543.1 hypothetical protein [Pseudomonas nitritireducens]